MLKAIRLSNFNSHEDSVYSFGPGVTWIKGYGGAGKSSIVSALGYAAFGYLPAPKTTCIKKGTRVGGVEAQYLRDGKRLSLQRSLHGSDHNAWLNGRKVADSFADSEAVVREFFGLPSSIRRVCDIWTAILCMEQDQITAPFLAAPGQRRLLFDGISGAESWRIAWSNLARSVTYLETEKKLKVQEAKLLDTGNRQDHLAGEWGIVKGKLDRFALMVEQNVCPTCGQPLKVNTTEDVAVQAAIAGEIAELEKRLAGIKNEMNALKSQASRQRLATEQTGLIDQDLARLELIRKWTREMGPLLSDRFVRAVSVRAGKYLRRLFPNATTELIWDDAYEVTVIKDGARLAFQANLSGSQRVLSAIALRLGIYDVMKLDHPLILDEPTINLDPEQISDVVELIASLPMPQIIVVSHDDEFGQIADNVLEVR